MSMEFRLVDLSPIGGTTSIRLEKGVQGVGRLFDNKLCLMDQSVSRHHARIEIQNNLVTVFDLDSANGTFINEVRISTSQLLPGQEVRFGTQRFRLVCVGMHAALSDIEDETPDVPEAKRRRALSHPQAAHLSDAERRVYVELISAKKEQAIADELYLSRETVHNHAKRIYVAFGVHTRADLILKLIES